MASELMSRDDLTHFDARTGTDTIANLLTGLDVGTVEQYLSFLEAIVVTNPAPSSGQDMDEDEGGEGEDEDEDEEKDAAKRSESHRVWAIGALHSATRSSALPGRQQWLPRVLNFLMAVGFFDTGSFASASAKIPALRAAASVSGEDGGKKGKKATPKKGKKGKKGAAAAEAELSPAEKIRRQEVLASFDVLDACLKTVPAALPPAVCRAAADRFFSIVADLMAHSGPLMPMVTAAKAADGNGVEPNQEVDATEAAKEEAARGPLEWLACVRGCWAALDATGVSMRETMEPEVVEELTDARALVASLAPAANADASTPKERLARAFTVLVSSASLLLLRGSEPDEAAAAAAAMGMGADEGAEASAAREEVMDLLRDLRKCYESMSKGQAKRATRSNEEDADEDDDESVDDMAVVADVCTAMVSGDGHAVRGVRQNVTRAWGLICSCEAATDASVATLVETVCGTNEANGDEEDEESEDEENEDEDEEDEEEEDGNEEEDEEEEDDEETNGAADAMEEDAEGQEDESEEGDDVVLGDEDALANILNGGGDENTDASDRALELMIRLRKQARPSKSAKLAALRARLQHRLRALDLLEQVVRMQPTTPCLMAAVLPLLVAIRRLQGSSAQVGEARDLGNRLSAFFKNKLCKCTVKLTTPEQVAEVNEATVALLSELRRRTAFTANNRKEHSDLTAAALGFCTRVLATADANLLAAAGTTAMEAEEEDEEESVPNTSEAVEAAFREAVIEYHTERSKCLLSGKVFDDLLTRNVDLGIKVSRRCEVVCVVCA